ncbi:MAG: glycosyltransferase, partial [Marinilabiliaceae bacterium]|nr:glycosyltransferase [Marinilabiliaceae bacterium]
PKITIITPSYNQGQYIEQTIRSIIDQGYPNLEYIIIDGESTDNTVEIIKKYADKLAFWVSEPDRGQAHAINKGLNWVFSNQQINKSTDNHLINWINSDDYLEPGALNALAKAYQKHPTKEVFCGYTHCFWEETGITSHTYRMGLKKSATKTLLNIKMNQPGTYYRADILQQLGGVNESLRYVFDNELWMRYLCQFGQKNVILIKDLLAHFRQHGGSKSFGEGFAAFNNEQQTILKFLCIQTELPEFLQEYVNRDSTDSKYLSKGWQFNYLNRKAFHAFFANKYAVSLYNDGLKKESKKAIGLAFNQFQLSLSRRTISLILKR